MERDNKAILITGASSEVGVNLIKRIYRDYNTMYLHYGHMNDSLSAVIDEISEATNVICLEADFNIPKEVEHMVNDILSGDILPNNIVHISAPPVHNKQFHKEEWEAFDMGWDISVRSVFFILKSLIPTMSKSKYGRIVFMLTSNTIGNPAKFQSAYVTYKYALLGLMKSLSVEYIDKGITVNAVSPDMMETKFLKDVPRLIVEQNAANSPLGRNIRVEEVAPMIEYFLSDNADAVTGQNVGITGGL